MKEISPGNFKKDTFYPKVVKAVGFLLKDHNEITTIDILLKMYRRHFREEPFFQFDRVIADDIFYHREAMGTAFRG